jgi:hypothetical protein
LPVVADVDQEVFPVAVPLGADPPDFRLFHHGQNQPTDDCSCRMSDFARQRPPVQRWLNELHIDAAETLVKATRDGNGCKI